MIQKPGFIQPDWPAPDNVRAYVSTRPGGFSQASYAGFNLGDHVGDSPEHVNKNRALLAETLQLPAEPVWLEQVHSSEIVNAADIASPVKADASYSREKEVVCVVMTADCLPVFFATDDGNEVAVAHAGWRGLAAGVLEATVRQFAVPGRHILCWLGPAIGPQQFEVGAEVKAAFMQSQEAARHAFVQSKNGKWLADIYQLARLQLQAAGVDQIFGGGYCTYNDAERFFSYRRDRQTGRMASLIWKR